MRTVAVGKGCVFFPFLFCIEMGWLMWVSVANHSIQKVQNLGNKRRQIYRKPRQESSLCDISYARSLEKYSPKFIDRHVGVPLRGTNMAAGKNKTSVFELSYKSMNSSLWELITIKEIYIFKQGVFR